MMAMTPSEAAASDMLRSRSRLAPEVRRLKLEERRVVLADFWPGAIAHAIPIAPPAASDVFELDDSAWPPRHAVPPTSSRLAVDADDADLARWVAVLHSPVSDASRAVRASWAGDLSVVDVSRCLVAPTWAGGILDPLCVSIQRVYLETPAQPHGRSRSTSALGRLTL